MAKSDKDYGNIFTGRVMIFLKESPGPHDLRFIASAVLPPEYTRADFSRVNHVMRNLLQAGMVTRELVDTNKKHVKKYLFTYIHGH